MEANHYFKILVGLRYYLVQLVQGPTNGEPPLLFGASIIIWFQIIKELNRYLIEAVLQNTNGMSRWVATYRYKTHKNKSWCK